MDEALYDEMLESERSYWWFVAKRRIVQSLIRRHLTVDEPSRSTRVLDVGCGTGAMLEELSGQGFTAVGCDTHEASLEACRRRSLEVSPASLPNDLPFPEESFDVAILSDVLEHVDDDSASLGRVVSLVRAGGLVICTVPAHPWMWTRRDNLHHHKRRYRRREFSRLLDRPNLAEELISYYNSALFPLMVAMRILSRWTGSDKKPDIKPLPVLINSLLQLVFESEKHLLGRIPLPPGGSLIAVHRRR